MIFRFVNFAGNEGSILPPNRSNTLKDLPTYEVDSFLLSSGYRDPFLGGVYQKKPRRNYRPAQKTQSVKKVKEEKVEVKIPFPRMNYGGSFFNKTLKKDVHLLEIDGVYHHVSSVGNYGKIEVSKVFKDSLEIKFNNEVKVLHH